MLKDLSGMSDTFLSNLMRAAHQITGATRCLAIDTDITILDTIGIDDDERKDPNFIAIVEASVKDAIAKGESVLSNNLITSPEQAPHTNTHLSGLRVILALPVQEYGAIYLDQSVRDGVFDRETIDQLTSLIAHLLNGGKLDLADGDIAALYGTV